MYAVSQAPGGKRKFSNGMYLTECFPESMFIDFKVMSQQNTIAILLLDKFPSFQFKIVTQGRLLNLPPPTSFLLKEIQKTSIHLWNEIKSLIKTEEAEIQFHSNTYSGVVTRTWEATPSLSLRSEGFGPQLLKLSPRDRSSKFIVLNTNEMCIRLE